SACALGARYETDALPRNGCLDLFQRERLGRVRTVEHALFRTQQMVIAVESHGLAQRVAHLVAGRRTAGDERELHTLAITRHFFKDCFEEFLVEAVHVTVPALAFACGQSVLSKNSDA